MAPRHLQVVLEDHRGTVRDDRTGDALGQWEGLSGLAAHPDIGFLRVHTLGLVDEADRAGVGAEELGRTLKDAFQERAEGELTGEILGDGAQCLGGPLIEGIDPVERWGCTSWGIRLSHPGTSS